MSKNVLSIMELDELDSADAIDGIEKVVGTAATPPQNAPTTSSLFEVKLHQNHAPSETTKFANDKKVAVNFRSTFAKSASHPPPRPCPRRLARVPRPSFGSATPMSHRATKMKRFGIP